MTWPNSPEPQLYLHQRHGPSAAYTHVVSKRGVVLFVAATACTRVTTGYSIDLHFFFSDLSPPLSEGDKGKKKLPYCLPFYSPIHVLL